MNTSVYEIIMGGIHKKLLKTYATHFFNNICKQCQLWSVGIMQGKKQNYLYWSLISGFKNETQWCYTSLIIFTMVTPDGEKIFKQYVDYFFINLDMTS